MDEATKRRMNAYYYSFMPTGVDAIDKILSAVACAGKSFHHTEDWQDDCPPSWDHKGNTPVEWIQRAAEDAAALLRTLAVPAPDAQALLARRPSPQPTTDTQPALREQIARYLTKRAGKVQNDVVHYETLSDGFKWAIREMPKDGPAPHWKTMPAWEWWGGQQADDILTLVSRAPQPAKPQRAQIELIARALCGAAGRNPDASEHFGHPVWTHYEGSAERLLTALAQETTHG